LKQERDPLYREVADVIVKVDNRSTNKMIEAIMTELLDIGVVSK